MRPPLPHPPRRRSRPPVLDTIVSGGYAARHRFLESVAVVVHTIGLPVFVTPRAPWVEQNAPGCTVTGGGFGFAVVGFGFGAAVVGFGFGLLVVGLTAGRDVGALLVRCGPGVGFTDGGGLTAAATSGVLPAASASGLVAAVGLSAMRSLTVAGAVATAFGFLSESSPMSAPAVPMPQQSRTVTAAAIPTTPRLLIFFLDG
ncbi:hypothetical protein [Micromonospora sp. NPDC047527]|uniref:hypothetical protein n=1 Tax=Micromonospora sp. NPDC047527 TaxID=3155144 RepID=UPI0033F3D04F